MKPAHRLLADILRLDSGRFPAFGPRTLAGLLSLYCAGGALRAEEPLPDAPEAPPGAFGRATQATDRLHHRLALSLDTFVRRADAFFSDKRVEQESDGSKLRIGGFAVVKEHGQLDTDYTFHVQLELPQTEKRFHLFFETLADDYLSEEDPDPGDPAPKSTVLGSRVDLLRRRKWLFTLKGGVRFRGLPTLVAQARLRKEVLFKSYLLRFTQYADWALDRGFGERTRFDVDRRLAGDWLARASTEVSWTERTEGVEWKETLSAVRVYDSRWGFQLAAQVRGHDSSALSVDDYRAWITVRRRTRWDWITLIATPLAEFPSERDYRFTPSFRIGLEASFDAPDSDAGNPPVHQND